MKIAVAGATGVVGHHVVDQARERGHEVVPLARSLGVDLTTGAGLADALAGVDAVVDATSTTAQGRAAAERFFESITGTLVAAETRSGVGHHIAVSIIGVDDVALGYYRGKQRQEQLIAQGPVPWSVLRTAQFHEFCLRALDVARVGPISLVPAMASQTIAAAEVAAGLIDLCEAGPSGRVPDFAGPEKNQMVDLARRYLRATRSNRKVIGLRVPGAGGRAMRAGRLRPATDGPRGTQTFEAWLHTL